MKGRALAIFLALLVLVSLYPAAMAQQSPGDQTTIVLSGISFSSDEAREGDIVWVTINVTNLSPSPKNNVSVLLYDNMIIAGEDQVDLPGVSEGGNGQVTFRWLTTRGPHQLMAIAQTMDGELSAPLSVLYMVNSSIEVRGFTYTPTEPKDGEEVQVWFRLYNDNNHSLENVSVVLEKPLISGFMGGEPEYRTLFEETDVDFLPNQYREFNFTWKAVYGNNTFRLTVIQHTSFGNDTLQQGWSWVEVENEDLEPGIALLGIMATILCILALAAVPSMIEMSRP